MKNSTEKEPILLRDILPKVMSDIRLRIAMRKAIESRTITGSSARENRRPGKVRSPGRSPAAQNAQNIDDKLQNPQLDSPRCPGWTDARRKGKA